VKTIDEYIEHFVRRKKNTRFNELKTVLLKVGFVMRQQKRGGSHFVFKHPKINTLAVLVTHGKNDLLPEYQIMKAVHALEQLKLEKG
jgi:predicted RNA binding protein YcfA (HicA-like mRNA interferase family)